MNQHFFFGELHVICSLFPKAIFVSTLTQWIYFMYIFGSSFRGGCVGRLLKISTFYKSYAFAAVYIDVAKSDSKKSMMHPKYIFLNPIYRCDKRIVLKKNGIRLAQIY